MSGIRLGLTLSHLDDLDALPEDIQVLEVDYALLLLASRAERSRLLALRRRFSKCEWIFSAPAVYLIDSNEEFVERWAVLNESAALFGVRRLLIRGMISSARFPSDLLVYLDLGQGTQHPDRSGFPLVSDPAWRSEACSGFLKVHGWHPARWVRRYGREAIVESVKRMRVSRLKDSDLLILGYSGRFAEWDVWKSVIQLAKFEEA